MAFFVIPFPWWLIHVLLSGSREATRTAEDAKHSDCGVSCQCRATATRSMDMQPGRGWPWPECGARAFHKMNWN